MFEKSQPAINTHISNKSVPIFICILSLILSSCTILNGSNNNLEATVSSMSLQATGIAQQATQDAQNLQATMLAQQATQLAMMQPPNPPPTQEPPTPAPPQITETPLVSQLPPTPNGELEAKIKAAKILLFEDVSGNMIGLLRYVKEALDNSGYSYTDVGSAQGWLKDQLVSQKEWDLIIIAAEISGMYSGQGRISGEYFNYLEHNLGQGVALVMELPTLNYIYQGNIRTILDRCGIEFQDNWTSPPSNSVWFLVPEHPIFHVPNEIGPSLRDYKKLWPDSGDIVKIKMRSGQPVGDAMLLAGTRLDKKDSYGTLTTCMGGRMILQTFATHQYNQEDIVRLWQNYVYYTLKNHFLYSSK